MKTRGNSVRVAEFQMRDKKRQLGQIDMMISEFERMSRELAVQIDAEERRSGISDPANFAYPTFAKAARQRRDNLSTSLSDLANQRQAALDAYEKAKDDFERAFALESREGKSVSHHLSGPDHSRSMIG